MGQKRHPDVSREARYLARVIQVRESNRARLSDPQAASAGVDRHSQRTIRRFLDRQLEAMQPPESPAALGRMDARSGESLYVGLETVSDGLVDLVIDWRDAEAAPWTESTSQDPRGLKRKRTFEYRGHTNELIDIRDELFDQMRRELFSPSSVGGTRDRRVRAVAEPRAKRRPALGVEVSDSLLEELERSRSGSMGQIVRTMAAAQAELVRTGLDNLLILQGGPGTGKTAIVLHRIAWLIYNYKIDDSEVLVVGPNRSFLKYIENVLPALGSARIAQVDVQSVSGYAAADLMTEAQEVAALKGSAVMADVLARSVEQRIKLPDSDVVWRSGGRRVVIPVGDVARELRRTSRMAYMDRRSELRSWLSTRAVEGARGDRSGFAALERRTLDQIVPSMTPRKLLADLFGSRKRLIAAAGGLLDQAQIDLLYRRASTRVDETIWSPSDLPLLDFASSLIQSEPVRTYRHIVIDEAQDLSPMALKMVARRSSDGSMTIAGDIAQSTGPFARHDWSDVSSHLFRNLPVIVRELKYGYRVPAQIFDVAKNLLPHVAPTVNPPEAVREGPSDPEYVRGREPDVVRLAVRAAKRHARARRSVGVVADRSIYDDLAGGLRGGGMDLSEVVSGSIGPAVNLMTPELAKGLEFDAVVVVEPQAIADSGPDGYRLLYIALTRATQHLTVVHSGMAIPTPKDRISNDARRLMALLRETSPPHLWKSTIEELAEMERVSREGR